MLTLILPTIPDRLPPWALDFTVRFNHDSEQSIDSRRLTCSFFTELIGYLITVHLVRIKSLARRRIDSFLNTNSIPLFLCLNRGINGSLLVSCFIDSEQSVFLRIFGSPGDVA